jgi:hypothetical protein
MTALEFALLQLGDPGGPDSLAAALPYEVLLGSRALLMD